MTTVFLDQIENAGKRALLAGRANPYRFSSGEAHARHWEADYAGHCAFPLLRKLFSRPDLKGSARSQTIDPKKGTAPFWMDMWVRCRQCRQCRCFKRSHWEQRAVQEVRAWERTWMVTLTIDQAHMYMVEAKAIRHFNDGGGDPEAPTWEHLSAEERDRIVIGLLGKEVTKWLKRVREYAEGRLRYLLVAEKGERFGRIHFHLLVHECTPGTVLWRHLTGRWTYGFIKAELVKGIGAARYLCKYLVKSMLVRVRASQDYGNPEPPIAAQRVPNTPLGHSGKPQANPRENDNSPSDDDLTRVSRRRIGGLINEISSRGLPRNVWLVSASESGGRLSKPPDELPKTSCVSCE